MLNAHNPGLPEYVTSHHCMETLAFHAISGRDLIQKFAIRNARGARARFQVGLDLQTAIKRILLDRDSDFL
jgi:hypothetical protein